MKQSYSTLPLILIAASLCSLLPYVEGNSGRNATESHSSHGVSANTVDLSATYYSGDAGLSCSDVVDVSTRLYPGCFPVSAGNTAFLPVAYPFDVIARVVGSIPGPSGEDTPRTIGKSGRITGILVNRLLPDRATLTAEKSRFQKIRKLLFPWHSFL